MVNVEKSHCIYTSRTPYMDRYQRNNDHPVHIKIS